MIVYLVCLFERLNGSIGYTPGKAFATVEDAKQEAILQGVSSTAGRDLSWRIVDEFSEHDHAPGTLVLMETHTWEDGKVRKLEHAAVLPIELVGVPA